MFLGHYGVAFALKRMEPKLSLGTLFVAVQPADLLWGVFLLAGWERVRIDPGYTAVTPLQFLEYPISHGLVGMALWAAVGAAVYYSWPTRDTSRHWQAAALVGLAILSHFALDLPVHAADLPLGGQDSRRVGFGPVEQPHGHAAARAGDARRGRHGVRRLPLAPPSGRGRDAWRAWWGSSSRSTW